MANILPPSTARSSAERDKLQNKLLDNLLDNLFEGTLRTPLVPWKGWSVVVVVAVLVALTVGYLAGLLSFKIKSRWCPRCGGTTTELARSYGGQLR